MEVNERCNALYCLRSFLLFQQKFNRKRKRQSILTLYLFGILRSRNGDHLRLIRLYSIKGSMSLVIKAPNPIPYNMKMKPKVFLAGSIDMGKAENWQTR